MSAYTPIKIGRGAAIHAAPVGTKSPMCQHISGHYSAVRGEAAINCKKCLAAIERDHEFLVKRGLA